MTIAGQRLDRTGRRIDGEDPCLAHILGGGVKAGAVWRPDQIIRRAVETGGQFTGRAGLHVADHDAGAWRGEGRAGLRQIGQPRPVRRDRQHPV